MAPIPSAKPARSSPQTVVRSTPCSLMRAGASAEPRLHRISKVIWPRLGGAVLFERRSRRRLASHPEVVGHRSLAAGIAGVRRALGLDQHQLDLVLGDRLVLDTLGDDVEFARADRDLAI